ncbi:MAG: hypothetical protein JSU66_05635, partial [Deltaproteobacteria bacterium]
MNTYARRRRAPWRGLVALLFLAASLPATAFERPSQARGRPGCRGNVSAGAPACQVLVVRPEPGPASLPSLPLGAPADLSLLDDAERAAVAAADARAAA